MSANGTAALKGASKVPDITYGSRSTTG